jgi:hypothetical protein
MAVGVALERRAAGAHGRHRGRAASHRSRSRDGGQGNRGEQDQRKCTHGSLALVSGHIVCANRSSACTLNLSNRCFCSKRSDMKIDLPAIEPGVLRRHAQSTARAGRLLPKQETLYVGSELKNSDGVRQRRLRSAVIMHRHTRAMTNERVHPGPDRRRPPVPYQGRA